MYIYIYVYSNFLILTLLQSTEKLRSAQGYINTEDQIRTKLSLSFIFMEQTVTMCLWEKKYGIYIHVRNPQPSCH